MRNQGQVLAFDTDDARLSRLGPRLKRAGVDIVTQMPMMMIITSMGITA